MKKILAAAVASLFFVSTSVAQTGEAKQLPRGSEVLKKRIVSHAAHWMVRIEAAEKAESAGQKQQAQAAAKLKSIEVIRVGKVSRSLLLLSNGRSIEEWKQGEIGVVFDTHLKTAIWQRPWFASNEVDRPEHPGVGPLPSFGDTDFPELEWLINMDASEDAMVLGQPCWIFTSGSKKKAAIHKTSGLPLVAVEGSLTRIYSYQTAPVGLEVPPKVKQELQAILDEYKNLNAPPPPRP